MFWVILMCSQSREDGAVESAQGHWGNEWWVLIQHVSLIRPHWNMKEISVIGYPPKGGMALV